MAPEQIEGKPRPASDQYSLAVVVYEWLCGIRPFQGNTFEIMHRHLYTSPAPLKTYVPRITPTVEFVVMKALSKDPQQRFESVQAFANALERAYQLESHSPTASLILPPSSSPEGMQIHPSIYFEVTKKDAPASPSTTPPIDEWPTMSMSATDKQEMQPGAEPQLTCPSCGAEVRQRDNFCLNCGRRIPSSSRKSQALEEADGITLPSQHDRILSREDWGASLLGLGSVIMPTIAPPSGDTGDVTVTPAKEQDVAKDQVAAGEDFATVADMSMSPSVPVTPPSPALPGIPSTPVTPPDYSSQGWRLIAAQRLERGNIHYNVKQYEAALAAYEQVLQLDSVQISAHIGKSNTLLRMGRHKEALAACDHALAIGLEHTDIWITKGEVLYKLKMHEQALAAYESALALMPRDVGVWTTKGNMLRNLKRYEEALAAYEQVLSLAPNNPSVWVLKGEMLYRLERYEDALSAYVYVSRFLPRRTAIWTSKGEILYKLQRYREALEAYEHARHLKPNDSSIANKCDMLHDLIKHSEATIVAPNILPSTVVTSIAPHEDQRKEARLPVPVHPIENELTARVVENEGNEQHEYFDVFLSYSEVDAGWVERLAGQLEDKHNFSVWLDKWMLIPGQSLQQGRARGIDQAKCVVVCIGKQTPSDWFEQEIERALNKQSKDKAFRVIPILLPEAKDINVDEFLKLRNSVDFRVADQAYAFYRLTCGIKGVAPGRWPPLSPDVSAITLKTNTIADKMLEDLRDKREKQLLEDSLVSEFERIVMEKVWLPQWLQLLKATDTIAEDTINE